MQTHRDGDFQRIYGMKHSVHANFLTLLMTWKTTFILCSLAISNFEGYRGKENSLVAHWIEHLSAHSTAKHLHFSSCLPASKYNNTGKTDRRDSADSHPKQCSQYNEPGRERKHRPSQSNMGLDQENTPG